MPNVLVHRKFVKTDVRENNNKVWQVTLFDNNDVKVEWGRVGKTLQTKTHAGGGRYKMDSLIRQKTGPRKGYKEIDVIETVAADKPKKVQSANLAQVAADQIDHTSPEVGKLITWLASVNRHTIMASTNLTFDDTTGLFSTPLGIVTPASVNQARRLLVTLGNHVANRSFDDNEYIDAIQEYLTLIPQDVGMKRGWHRTFLPNVRAVQKQGDILDSLEASYRAAVSGSAKKPKKDEPQERVFDVKLHILDDRATTRKIERMFYDSINRSHTSASLKPKKIFVVKIAEVAEAFAANAKHVGNIMELWHGTKASNLLSILKSGLVIPPASSSHVTGRMYGDGLYFSDQSTKALNYATTFWGGRDEGRYFMFVAAVAMGKMYKPHSGGGRYPHNGFDSTFAEAGRSGVRNNEMIVYRTNQVDLRYLVEFGY